MMEQLASSGTLDYKDRIAGLIVFGIIEICIGLLCVLAVPLMLLATLATAMQGGAGAAWRTTVPGLLMYVALAAWFICIGIGSIRARRWARALMLVFSWIWLITGILSVAFMAYLIPAVSRQTGETASGVDAAVLSTGLLVAGVFLFLIYVVLPGIFVLFYRSPHVRDTCDVRNPEPCWTDACPLPVLAVVAMMTFGLFSMLWMPCYNFVMPCFGVFLSGLPGAAVWLCMTALLVVLIRGLYKLKTAAWWAVVALIPLGGISAALTMTSENLPIMYEKMGIPTEQFEAFLEMGFFQGTGMAIYMAVASAAMLGYLVYMKRFFDSGADRAFE